MDNFGKGLLAYIQGLLDIDANLDNDFEQNKLKHEITKYIYNEIENRRYSVYEQDESGYLFATSLQNFMNKLISYKFTKYDLSTMITINCKQIYLGKGEMEYIVLTLI